MKSENFQAFTKDGHHWSGWPGACCLKCGCADPAEIALADRLWEVDLESEKIRWLGTEEQKAKLEEAQECPVKGVLVWSTSLRIFELQNGGEGSK